MRWLLLLALVGCTGAETDTEPTQTETDDPWEPAEGGVIHLVTQDDVTLEADYYPALSEGRPGIVLLHMIPPGNDRTNWPASFIDTLYAHNWSVLVVDRRGAGGSEGVASAAYTGPKGKFDVEACALRLRDDGAGPLGIIGASNGTTSMIDYTAWAGGEGLPVPMVHGFMSGGSYTENQTEMEAVADIYSIFVYPASEAAWSDAQQSLNPGWAFHEYPGSAHGTHLFADTSAGADLDSYLAGAFGE